jgi:hypothetical protein
MLREFHDPAVDDIADKLDRTYENLGRKIERERNRVKGKDEALAKVGTSMSPKGVRDAIGDLIKKEREKAAAHASKAATLLATGSINEAAKEILEAQHILQQVEGKEKVQSAFY